MQQHGSFRKVFSPWVLAVAVAFLLGLYLGQLGSWRAGNNALARADRGSVGRSHAHAHGRVTGLSSKVRAGKRKAALLDELEDAEDERPEEEEEEPVEDEDEVVEEDEDEPPRRRSSKSASKHSTKKSHTRGGSKPASKPRAKAGLGVVEAPPKPDGEPLTVTYFDGHSISVYPHIDHGAGGINWWPAVTGGWEVDTLLAMRFFIKLHKHSTGGRALQIDFGCWVGPTALFSAHYADKIYALEPDPAAFREAYHNFELNPALSPKIDKRRVCISDKPGALTLYGSPGDSMSSSFPDINPTQRKGYTQWTVDCTTLDTFIEAEGIDTDEIALIKIDTEGHEAPIMWQLRDWLKAHPNIIISLSIHAFLYPDGNNPEHRRMQEQLQTVIMDYKTVLFTHGDVVDKAAFTVGGWCRLCSLILTNMEAPPAPFASWKDALNARELPW